MIRRCYVLLLAVASLAVGASLSGCGSSGSPAPTAAATATAANVTLAAKFPTADGAVKSLLPANTAAIEVFAIILPISQTGTLPTLLATLTPTAPSKAVKLAPGQYLITATAYNSTDPATRTVLGETSTAGEVLANVPNIINLTFLNGQWNLTTPIVLSDGVTQLNDLVVTGGGSFAVKSAFDYTKPVSGGDGSVTLRFNNNTSARTFGGMLTQFVGASNSIALFVDAYNITKKCSDNNQLNCSPTSGDKLIVIEGTPAGGLPTGDIGNLFFEGDRLQGYASALLPNKGETSFSQPVLANTAAATTDGKTITGNLIEFALTANPTRTYKTGTSPAKAVPAAVKSAQSANTAYNGLVVTDYDLMICATTATPNQGGWVFQSPAQTIGTATCYASGFLQPTFNPTTQQQVYNPGDFSYHLSPATADLGDYCHQWDYNPYLPFDPVTNPTGTAPNPYYNTCKQQPPSNGDIYYPYNFIAKRTASKTAISYGSFKLSAWIEETKTGNAYVYPFTATGTTVVTPAK